MNILHIVHNLSGGGAEKVAGSISTYINKHDNQTINDFLVYEDKVDYPYTGNIKCYKLKKYSFPLISLFKRFKDKKNLITKIKTEGNYDVCISHSIIENVINCETKHLNKKTIIVVHNNLSKCAEFKGIKKILFKKRLIKAYNNADVIVAVSKQLKEDVVKVLGCSSEKVQVIYNGFDLAELSNTTASSTFDKNDFNVINVGRNVDFKAQWHSIYAFKDVLTSIPNAKLHIFGEGNISEKLMKLTRDLQLDNYVKFYPFTKEIHKRMKEADVLISSSIREGFGNVLVEALALGVPVISTACESGPFEIIAEKYDMNVKVTENLRTDLGILIPPFSMNGISKLTKADRINHKNLANAIIDIYNNPIPSHQLVEGAKRFYTEEVSKLWIDLFFRKLV